MIKTSRRQLLTGLIALAAAPAIVRAASRSFGGGGLAGRGVPQNLPQWPVRRI